MTNEAQTTPRTIRDLIAATEAIGGRVEMTSERRYEFLMPCRMVGGAVRLVNRGAVGYYVRDGKNIISGSTKIRTELAYWARQSRA